MNNFKYKFVIATPYNEKEFKEKSKICLTLDKLLKFSDSHIVYENKQGLPKIYNQFISESNKDTFLVFVHDDVIIEDLFFKEKLCSAFEKYDIVGLAGTKSCDVNSEMSAWHLMSPRNNFVGEVCHSHDKLFWTTPFGKTPSRALLIDGLFIGVNVNRLLETNTKFDEDFEFHHYDISFCLTANQNKLKIGVYPIKVTHFGLGNSMNSPEWFNSSIKFKQKYAIQ
jgi:hypothetical protein